MKEKILKNKIAEHFYYCPEGPNRPIGPKATKTVNSKITQ
jgi:hypothetical protein